MKKERSLRCDGMMKDDELKQKLHKKAQWSAVGQRT